MGVKGLLGCARAAPNCCTTVNIRDAIRNHDGIPTIVIYYRALFEPLSSQDSVGVLCGGRYELAYQIVNRFLKRLVQLGAKLVFFGSGPRGEERGKLETGSWEERVKLETENYDEEEVKFEVNRMRIVDMVDAGTDIREILRNYRDCPQNNRYPVKLLAKRYGQFRVPVQGDCKKNMLAYANSVNALAIITNNSDFLIFEGPWRFWSSKDLNFEKLTTVECNRAALRQHLGLETIEQMALLGALANTNKFLRIEEPHCLTFTETLPSLANFVRHPHDDVVLEVFGPSANEGDLRERFQKSLDYYGTQEAPFECLDLDFFKELDFYKMWAGHPIEPYDVGVSLREDGPTQLDLSTQIMLRATAIIAFHRQSERTSQDFRFRKNQKKTFPIAFPQHIAPPTLEELLSQDPNIRANLTTTKLQLFSWIISDTLDPTKLAAIPPKLLPTVATIYLLYESRLIELNEADLLLEVAYEIAFNRYDMFRIRYPARLNPRAYRVALFYPEICLDTAKALAAVGLDDGSGAEYPGYPLFDGVLFHNLYRKWTHGQGELEPIEQWRIYADIF